MNEWIEWSVTKKVSFRKRSDMKFVCKKVVNMWSRKKRLQLSNDVEKNPGPQGNGTKVYHIDYLPINVNHMAKKYICIVNQNNQISTDSFLFLNIRHVDCNLLHQCSLISAVLATFNKFKKYPNITWYWLALYTLAHFLHKPTYRGVIPLVTTYEENGKTSALYFLKER